MDETSRLAFVQYLLRLGDDRLVLGHRLSEWCGHGPILEEDIAITNIALDLVGQATLLLKLAGDTEGAGRNEDALAYFRDARDYRNALMVELPKGDFAFTIVRQFLFSVYSVELWTALSTSVSVELAGIAAKALKESRYHVRHAGGWVIRLGDGTDESHAKMQSAVNDLWTYTGELFLADDLDAGMAAAGIGPDLASLREPWLERVRAVFEEATLAVPGDGWMQRGGKQGVHTEKLGFLLAEMQFLQRAYPGATW